MDRLREAWALLDDSAALLKRGQIRAAFDRANQALMHDPVCARALYTAGALSCEFWHHRRGAALLQRAIDIDPTDSRYFAVLGLAQHQLGDHANAERGYLRALSIADQPAAAAGLQRLRTELANRTPPSRPCVLVTFGTRAFTRNQAALRESALDRGGFADSIDWTPDLLRSTWLYADHADILDEPRGAGYWVWKPFIILDALKRVAAGDYVVYYDCGRADGFRFRQSIAPLIEWCEHENNGMLPGVYWPATRNAYWTKRDCFVLMGADVESIWAAGQAQATFSVWKRTPGNIAIVERWLDYCCDRRIVTDDPNVCGLPNLPGFIDHRHDQSVLNNVMHQRGLRCFGRPDQGTPFPKDINSTITRVLREAAPRVI